MGQGLQIFNANGTIAYDSDMAIGGVCLDIVYIPVGPQTDSVFNFPDLGTGYTGFVKDILGDAIDYFTYSEANGYPSFTISWAFGGYGLALFIK